MGGGARRSGQRPKPLRGGANPCAAKNPCGANPCAAKNPCGGNPCNPCGGGGASARFEGVMISGKVAGYKGNFLNIQSANGKVIPVHLQKTTIAHIGNKTVGAKTFRRGMAVSISTQARENYHKANFIYARAGGGGGNPCGGNPCAAKNPCGGKNRCGGNPCAAKNPCAKRK